MKLFFASDLHGALPAAEKMLQQFTQSGANTLILLGDLLNHGPRNPIPEGYNPPAVAEKLNEYAKQIIAVRGNCDSEVDQMLLNFPIMSDFAWVLLPSGQRLFLTHGHLYDEQTLPPLSIDDIVVHGHTHLVRAERCGNHFVLNPGSVTFPRSQAVASFAVLDGFCFTVYGFEGETLASLDLSQ
ncbi:TPA: phosphodiesterase [Vibrio metschnikovii]